MESGKVTTPTATGAAFQHEAETVEIRVEDSVSRVELHTYLLSVGYKSVDDFYCLNRRDHVERWQTQEVLVVESLLSGEPTDETEEEIEEETSTPWDSLRCEYLLPTMPAWCVSEFVNAVDAIARRFDGDLVHREKRVDAPTLLQTLNSYVQRIESEYGLPVGSEDLAIILQIPRQPWGVY